MKVAQGTRGVVTGDPQAIRPLTLPEQPHSHLIHTSGFCTDTSFETTNVQSPSFLLAREAHSRLSSGVPDAELHAVCCCPAGPSACLCLSGARATLLYPSSSNEYFLILHDSA